MILNWYDSMRVNAMQPFNRTIGGCFRRRDQISFVRSCPDQAPAPIYQLSVRRRPYPLSAARQTRGGWKPILSKSRLHAPQAPAGESPVNGGLGALRIAGAANPSVQRKMHDMDSRLHAAEAPQIVEHQIGISAFFRPHHRWRVTHTQLHKDGSSFRCDGDPTKRWRRAASTETPPDPMPSGVNSFHLPWKNWQTANAREIAMRSFMSISPSSVRIVFALVPLRLLPPPSCLVRFHYRTLVNVTFCVR